MPAPVQPWRTTIMSTSSRPTAFQTRGLGRITFFLNHHFSDFAMTAERVAQAVGFLDRDRPRPERCGHSVAQADGPTVRLFDDLEGMHRSRSRLAGHGRVQRFARSVIDPDQIEASARLI